LQLLISRLHDTTGCQLVEQLSNRLNNRVGLFVYTMQPVVQPVVGCTMTAVQNRLSVVQWRLYNRLFIWLNVCIQDITGCATGTSTRWRTGCIV